VLDCRQAVIISVRMTSESCESVTVTGPENGAVTVIFLKEALLLTTLPSFESAPPPLNPIPNVNWFFVGSGLRLISLPVIMLLSAPTTVNDTPLHWCVKRKSSPAARMPGPATRLPAFDRVAYRLISGTLPSIGEGSVGGPQHRGDAATA